METGWMGGWVDGWMDGKANLRIAYSNQKDQNRSSDFKFDAKTTFRFGTPDALA